MNINAHRVPITNESALRQSGVGSKILLGGVPATIHVFSRLENGDVEPVELVDTGITGDKECVPEDQEAHP